MGDVIAARRLRAGRTPDHEVRGDGLFERIGAFLDDHRLNPNPANYAFAHGLISAPDSPLSLAVAQMVDGGVRLNQHDLAKLGTAIAAGTPIARNRTRSTPAGADAITAEEKTASLVAETQAQVDGFAAMVRSMQAETRGFGRDLAESAEAFTRAPKIAEIDEVARITSAMITRIHDTEVRLARANEETEALRTKLAEARDTARRDPLTGLPNRRAFDEAFAACVTDETSYCLAVCDVDRFKRINDDHGHGVGDRVLSAIGQTLATACEGHLVVRHGGEEFAVLMQGISLQDAAALLDEARCAVSAKRFRNRDTDVAIGKITFSAGVTAVHVDDDAESALSRADQLLYAAKTAGRDQVSVA